MGLAELMQETTEMDIAWKHLTKKQQEDVEHMWKKGNGISHIACKLALTRSFVHSYVRKLNSKR